MNPRAEDASSDDLESTPALRQARSRIGTTLRGKWRIDGLVGIGGMGAVYAATHRNGRRCAIKVLLPLHGADRKTVQRFLKEGYVANEIAHPDAVEIYDDDFTDEGLPFLVMELLEGQSLTAKLEEPPFRLEVEQAVTVAADLLHVLDAAHARGIVHRDVKPDNVFLLTSGKLKLLDFGIARLRTMTAAGTTTASGAILGTPAFMSPEQARGRIEEVDARSDVFGAGATLFNALSGHPVRDADTLNELLLHAMTQPARPLRDLASDIPADLAAIVDRSLAFSREDRWPSASAMRDALLALGSGAAATMPRVVASVPPPADGGAGPHDATIDSCAAGSEHAATQLTIDTPASRGRPRAVRVRRSFAVASVLVVTSVAAAVVAGWGGRRLGSAPVSTSAVPESSAPSRAPAPAAEPQPSTAKDASAGATAASATGTAASASGTAASATPEAASTSPKAASAATPAMSTNHARAVAAPRRTAKPEAGAGDPPGGSAESAPSARPAPAPPDMLQRRL